MMNYKNGATAYRIPLSRSCLAKNAAIASANSALFGGHNFNADDGCRIVV